MEVLTLTILEDLDMPEATVGDRSLAFARPDLTSFCRLDELGLVVTGSAWSPAGRFSRAGSSSQTMATTGGVAVAVARVRRATP